MFNLGHTCQWCWAFPQWSGNTRAILWASLSFCSNQFESFLTISGSITSHSLTSVLSQVTTLQSVLENMTVEEMEDTLIIIFIAETDPDSVFQISSDVQKQFHQARNQEKEIKFWNFDPQHLESGLMEVISPPSEFYPDLAGLRKTLGKERSEDNWGFLQQKNTQNIQQGTIWREWLGVPNSPSISVSSWCKYKWHVVLFLLYRTVIFKTWRKNACFLN